MKVEESLQSTQNVLWQTNLLTGQMHQTRILYESDGNFHYPSTVIHKMNSFQGLGWQHSFQVVFFQLRMKTQGIIFPQIHAQDLF